VERVPEGNAQQVGAQVRVEREKAKLSIAQLATDAGLSKAYVVRLENGATNPSLGVLDQIAKALDITVADLVRSPVVRFDISEVDVSPSLRVFADEASLTSMELRTLASIRWRRGEEPRTAERWRYIFDSLRLSRSMDPDDAPR
jgi:transcriptional regulator with XRE-family HTH domain